MNRILDARDRSLLLGFGLVAGLAATAILGIAVVVGLAVRIFLALAGLG